MGTPTVVVTTTEFETLTREVAASYGLADVRVAVVEHPPGGISDEEVAERARAAAESVLGLLSASGDA